MRPTCNWCTRTAQGTAEDHNGHRRMSCGDHGRNFLSDFHTSKTTEESTMNNDGPLADWERELLDGARIEREVTSIYRVEIHKPFGVTVVGTYTAEEYEGMRLLIRDVNASESSPFSVVRIDTEVKTVTTTEITEVSL